MVRERGVELDHSTINRWILAWVVIKATHSVLVERWEAWFAPPIETITKQRIYYEEIPERWTHSKKTVQFGTNIDCTGLEHASRNHAPKAFVALLLFLSQIK